MSWLLIVQPDSGQADALREALRVCTSEDEEIVVAESIEEALASIDRCIPDIVLLPAIIPAAVEDCLITYLAAIPGARHVQILGIPLLARSDNSVQPQTRSVFSWRRRQQSRIVGTPGCDPGIFIQDVIRYLASSRALKEELELYGEHAPSSKGAERRSEPRFANFKVPWISITCFGSGRAALINVSSRGALLLTETRPAHHFLRRTDPALQERLRLTIELGPDREVDAFGRVIRCVPSGTGAGTQYKVAFSFDDSVRLHLPVDGALVSAHSDATPYLSKGLEYSAR